MASPSLPLRSAGTRAAQTPRIGALTTIWLVSGALGLLSLLGPASPTYDPFAWLIWGREIVGLDLDTTFGPSWKPLPVLLTTLLALVPDAAADLWVAIARAGAIASLVLAFRVGRRLGGGVAGGLVAAGCLAVSTDYLRYAAIGDSEGLLVALLLAAADLHLTGRRRAALWLLLGACLLRPEAWPWAGLYALHLVRADRAAWRLAAGMAVACLALWLVPEWWGSGDPLRAGGRALQPNPNAIAFADVPAWEALQRTLAMTPWPAELGMVALAIAWLAGWWRDRRVAAIAVVAAGWTAVVMAMTEIGFSGNARYMIAPVALACVAGGTAWGWTLQRLAHAGAHARAITVAGLAVAAALLVAPAAQLDDDARAVRNEARLNAALAEAIAATGGADAVLACGSVTTGPFQVTPLAYQLGAHIRRVGLEPSVPGAVFRAYPGPRVIPGAPPVVIDDETPWHEAAHVDPWQVLRSCAGAAR